MNMARKPNLLIEFGRIADRTEVVGMKADSLADFVLGRDVARTPIADLPSEETVMQVVSGAEDLLRLARAVMSRRVYADRTISKAQ
jgi:hypothetical protein